MDDNELIFEPFPRIGRLKRDCTITEKVDGTNAQIVFDYLGNLLVGSRKREIFPNGTEGKGNACDNYGFARWAYNNKVELFAYLGPGRHYGEWTGPGIGRGYGLAENRLYLFNTFRHDAPPRELQLLGLDVVPVLYQGPFLSDVIDITMQGLHDNGSLIGRDTEHFPNPEGIIIYHHGTRTYAKYTFEHDATGKGE